MGIETAILGGAVIGGGLSFLGAKEQSKGAKEAAKVQASSADQALALQQYMYETSRSDLAPWLAAGERSLADLERLQGTYEGAVFNPNQYVESPGYQWLQQQGIDALAKGAAAAGKLDSGQYPMDVLKYGQGLALQDYTGYLARLESLMNRYAGTSGVGQTAAGGLANLGQNYASNAGNIYQAQGNATANQYINQANSRTGLYSNLANISSNAINQYMLYDTLKNAR